MLKLFFLIIITIVVLIVLLAIALRIFFYPDKKRILKFLLRHPERSAILYKYNGKVLAALNEHKMMPLASTVKIIIAIEYAEQAARQSIYPDEAIPISELDCYYIPRTDGGAHLLWLKSLNTRKQSDTATIREIAKGMIEYSSNANTEWLLDKLGLDNVNNKLSRLGLEQHEPLYYFVSSLLIGAEKFPDISKQDLVGKLKEIPQARYIEYANQIHGQLKHQKNKEITSRKFAMPIKAQNVWSDKLPASTATDYINIMSKINSRNYFDASTQQFLDELLEYPLNNPINREWLEHCGMKGGSTASVLTKALYATDKKGNKTELAYFLRDLSFLQTLRLQACMNAFELALLTDDRFREELSREFMPVSTG